ncbi:hypothetical protein BO94DRAFT_27992 [Aspergillus sclerotioniger CBS 115572]|uniref:Uncharacterized protein n=1 Tax=Aspergillus sclerotioniger CBS 115572 TaxID=1450535 RepID=A0A317WVW6_9EURO|nr:hypothetical protein BO94DRAFT_27992 [Aspergillus sclerotioniger CBS 115572]PWY90516.1 hypothetical protein BO94DRAFT_27992 [Aspergillus sclerotioniger CBS 115572]
MLGKPSPVLSCHSTLVSAPHLPLQASLSVNIVAVSSATYEVILVVQSRVLWLWKGLEEPLCVLVLLPFKADTNSACLD